MPTIRFHFPEDAEQGVRVAYQPVLESLFSLSVLAEPQLYPLRHPWVREMRRSLPPALRREIAACSFALGKTSATGLSWLPNPLATFPLETGDSGSFAATMQAFANLADDTVLRWLEPLEVMDGNGRSGDARAALTAARRDPFAFWQRLCNLITAYWDAAFAAEWERIEPVLSDSAAEANRVLAAGGISALAASVGPRAHATRERRGIRLDLWVCRPRETNGVTLEPPDVNVEIEETFALVPSTFTWPRVWFNIEPPVPSASPSGHLLSCATRVSLHLRTISSCFCGPARTRSGCTRCVGSRKNLAAHRSSPRSSGLPTRGCRSTSACSPRPDWSRQTAKVATSSTACETAA